jgi:hypothetical protein
VVRHIRMQEHQLFREAIDWGFQLFHFGCRWLLRSWSVLSYNRPCRLRFPDRAYTTSKGAGQHDRVIGQTAISQLIIS